MMSNNADIELTFSKDNVKETLQSHSTIIRLTSPVLAHALDLQSTGSSSSVTLRQLPLPGTSKADFLVVAQFLYPVVLPLKVSWDILEVLLVEGRKWDMQVRHVAAALWHPGSPDCQNIGITRLIRCNSSSNECCSWFKQAHIHIYMFKPYMCSMAKHLHAMRRTHCNRCSGSPAE
jgi:hypothetical protein